MNPEIENALLKTKSIPEFQEVADQYGLKKLNEFSVKALKHFNTLGIDKEGYWNHTDPARKKRQD